MRATEKKPVAASGRTIPAPFFGRKPARSGVPVIQPKLTVNAPGDRYEQEADAMADRVIRMSDASTEAVQRRCAHCEEEERKQLQRKPVSEGITPLIQTKSGDDGSEVSPRFASSLQSAGRDGRPLPPDARHFMESRFGVDFSDVSIHTDSKAVQLSRDVNAQAFTHGNDIYFNEGKFAPGTARGKHLLAHELTHVIQQNAAPSLQRSCGTAGIGDPRTQCLGRSGLVVGHRFLFQVNCDEFRQDTSPAQDLALRSFVAGSITNGDRINIHGFASEDGGAEYNDKLSCARAVRAQDIIKNELSIRGISATTAIFRHGEVPGDHERHRAVVLETESDAPYSEDPSQISFVPCSAFPRSLGTRGACGAGTDFTFHDFPSLSSTDNAKVVLHRLMPDFQLLAEMRAVLLSLGGMEGSHATSRFAAGTGATHRFGPTDPMSLEAQGTSTFDAVRRALESDLNAAITGQAASGVVDCDALTIPVGTLPGISFPVSESVRLKAIIGGTQGLELELISLNLNPVSRTYEAQIRFIICDDFGVDHNDLYAPGLIPFWVLQHERSGFRPYIHELVIEETFRDSF